MVQRITPKALAEWLQAVDRTPPVLLDVREPWEFDICHLVGATLIPLTTLPSRTAHLESKAEIVVICHHGVRSQHAALFLAQQGFQHLYNLEGGIDQWAREIDQSLSIY